MFTTGNYVLIVRVLFAPTTTIPPHTTAAITRARDVLSSTYVRAENDWPTFGYDGNSLPILKGSVLIFTLTCDCYYYFRLRRERFLASDSALYEGGVPLLIFNFSTKKHLISFKVRELLIHLSNLLFHFS